MGALDGTRVVDFGQYIAGPLTAQLLADQGADVIRVDPPGGPAWDTPANATWNRGKRSIALDLKSDGDRELARSLVANADVVIENFRPGVMDRLGLGAEAMTAAQPRLIYCSLPGFAPDDPRASVRAWEGVVGAASGTYRSVRVGSEAGTPVYTALPIASSYAAIQAAVAVTIALAVRDRDGVGQQIIVPLFDAMFGAVGYNGIKVHASDIPALGGGFGLTTQFECADGRWVMFHTGNGRTEQVFEAFGVGSWVAEGMADRARLTADPELAAELQRRAVALFKTRPAAEWEVLVAEAGGECAVCRESADWIDHPHARGSEIIVEVDDPTHGPMRQPGIPARLSRTPGAVRGPAHRLDADRDAIVA
ncbi:MAG: CoA transferase, partial [Chloroflexi bacterium]|nr:CoA transferase [Chloroflexota bacterium]